MTQFFAITKTWGHRKIIRLVARWSEDWAAKLAFNRWFDPIISSGGAERDPQSEDAEIQWIESEGVRVATKRIGYGPAVLLLHGLHGSMGDMTPLARAVASVGCSAVLMDAPGHGLSSQVPVDGVLVAQFIELLEAECGPFRSIVAHSGASIWSTYALSRGVKAERLVLLAPVAGSEQVVAGFAHLWKLSPSIAARVGKLLVQFYGAETWRRFSPVLIAFEIRARVLLIHDAGDRVIPPAESQRLLNAFPEAELFSTSGLGHRRILKDRNVLERVAEFCS